MSNLVMFLGCSRLVATDTNFQAVYDIIMIHFVLFILYKVVKDSLQAGRLVWLEVGFSVSMVICCYGNMLLGYSLI